ncbi:glycosyltransferase family 4 protein [Chryseobacterium sp.]|uniref:glycosyltransferase family 4 protein n=1 Tax=Chryseobacterium sp. TaxID=1871047 RepID=UPI00289F25CA|nr:glycosyltransferase family 4 protein [Chryseobacterium sp.]
MNSNKRILFFFPENPFSKRAGNVARSYTNLRHLKSLGLNIDLVGVDEFYRGFDDSVESVDKNIIDDVLILKRRPVRDLSSYTYWKYKIIKLFTKQKTENNGYFYTRYFLDTFAEFYQKKNYDYVLINYEFWTDLIRKIDLKGATTIVDTHDWITLNEYYKNKKLNIGEKFNEEIQNLAFYDKVITISNEEHFIFKSFLGDKVINIPPSFPENFETEATRKEYDLIFVGSDNPFNVDALNWFIEHVLPLLNSDIRICVIGRICKRIPDHDSIEKFFFVDQLKEFYHKSKVAICPMLGGTGIKIKVVEALSFGIPVVGTDKAVDGFFQKTGNGCQVSDDPQKFADIVMQLISDPVLYEKQKEEAIQFFKNNFTEDKAIALWKSILN